MTTMNCSRCLVCLAALCLVAFAAGVSAEPPPSEATAYETEAWSSAQFVGDAACLDCHEDQALSPDQIHARIDPFEVRGHTVGCEGCHGPGSVHSEEMDLDSIRRFGPEGLGDDGCMSCHQWKGMTTWHASTHAMEAVGCSDCHRVHSPDPQLKLAAQSCASCHGDVLASFRLPSHHPLPEGKMNCADCHDVHGSREAMLRTELRPNDLCYDCHQDKEGPFIFEHEPVQEDCSTCHTPHGSVADSLLTANEPTLCLQCHEPHFHSGYRASDLAEVDVGGIERENPFGNAGFNIAFTTSCSDCHSQVHGSDLPSQTVPGGGRGLTH